MAIKFKSGRKADEVVQRDAAALEWMANLGCLELHPHAVRTEHLEQPEELRVDLDPMPGIEWEQIQAVAGVVREVLAESGLVGWPKTSGSRGVHVNVRIQRRWSFTQVRRAALALAREVERRAPGLATSKWWKEERHGVFLDYNQNAKDRTVASAYSVRPKPDARVSAPVTWDELFDCRPEDFTLRSMPARFAAVGAQRVRTNADCSGRLLEDVAMPDDTGLALLRSASEAMGLSARAFHRTLKVARTIADLDGAERVGRTHVAEALSYRGEAMRAERAA